MSIFNNLSKQKAKKCIRLNKNIRRTKAQKKARAYSMRQFKDMPYSPDYIDSNLGVVITSHAKVTPYRRNRT